MIKEALDSQVLPHSLEIATITLLPKPGKDQQKCGSYRPLSLLNSDYKVLSKIIALRLENVIPKIIHTDQTGFVKIRQGADNVRRLFHIINGAQKQKHPMVIISTEGIRQNRAEFYKPSNILPKFIYLFPCIPFKIPKYFFKDLNKTISTFLWYKKTPRVNLITLQAPYAKGGLNLQNFRLYLASQFRPLWIWLHSNNNEVRWVSTEQHEMKTTPITIIPFLGTRKNLSLITKNPVLLDTFGAWQESLTLLGLSTLLFANLLDANDIPSPIADRILKTWIKKGIKTIGDLYVNGIFSSFLQLSELFSLPNHNLFKYLQIRHWVGSQSLGSFTNIPEKSPFENCLFDSRLTSTKGLTSSILQHPY